MKVSGIKSTLAFLALLSSASGQGLIANADATQVKTLDSQFLRNYAETRGFMLGRPVKAKISPDGRSVLFLRAQARKPQQSLFIFDPATGKSRELLNPTQVLKGAQESLSPEEKARRERQRISVGGFTDFQISQDSSLILLSLSGKLYVLERASGKIKELATGENAIDPKFSPDSKFVSYVKDNDLHVLSLKTGKSQQITKGGTAVISHGLAEFVAQEELDRFTGYWWSPDSKYIAFEEADARGVEVWHLSDPENPDQKPVPNFYPRPGKKNVITKLGVVSLSGGKSIWINWDREKLPYLANVSWQENCPLTLVVLSREQKELQVLEADQKTGRTKLLLQERDKDWINLFKEMPYWLEDGKAFLWMTERNGANELELRGRDGRLQKVLLGKSSGLIALSDAGKAADPLFFEASTDPKESRIYRLSPEGKASLLSKDSAGITQANFSKDHKVFVQYSSLLDSMPQTTIHKADGTTTGMLPSIAEDPGFKPVLQFVELDCPQKFQTVIIRPQNFNPKLRYPVIVDVYGGPHKIKVTKSMRSYLLDQWIADQGFIVVSIDGRGTPGRGRDWERAIAHKFGELPLNDQIEALKLLTEKFPEMDGNRVGITGWSFGGYMSALAVLKRSDFFKAAVAGAPVTDWQDYDSCYTERYLGLPEKNPESYKSSSLFTYTTQLKSPLLLVHGTTDDNVFFRHSLKLADALFRSGKDFGMLPLSGFTHMVSDPVVMEALWQRIIAQFHSALGQAE